MRPLIVCADDYGLAPGVSNAIRTLIQARRLTATGCMVIFPEWQQSASELKPLAPLADVGLHLTLTDHTPLTPLPCLLQDGRLPTIGRLLPMALGRRLNRADIRREIDAQLDAFEAGWGKGPDFVDGHQHVHILPTVREALLGALSARYAPGSYYLRDCHEPYHRCLLRKAQVSKSLIISSLATSFSRQLQQRGIRHNRGFSGLHDFSGRPAMAALMPRFLAHTGSRPLLHVHPGQVDEILIQRDSLRTPREWEFAYLASDDFALALNKAGFRPATFSSQETHDAT